MDLKQAQKLKTKAEVLKARLSRIKDWILSITARNDGLPKSTNHESQIEKLMIEKLEVENELQETENQMIDAQISLSAEIEDSLKLTELEKQVLIRRYSLLEDFAKIATALFISQSYCYQLHRDAVKKVNFG